MELYKLEWSSTDIKGAIRIGFSYLETMNEIAGFICARPEIVKKILLAFQDEFRCDFIPNGVGILRTAYVLYKSLKWNEIRFVNRDKTIELQIILTGQKYEHNNG
jgi:hypothetical protein